MPYQVSAILLAAGLSKRMGRLKQLLPIRDKPVIRHCLDCIIAAGIKNIVVVLGHQGDEILNALSVKKNQMKIVFNQNPESEMAESVRIALRAIDDPTRPNGAVLIYPSDYPLVSARTLAAIINCHFKEPDKIVIPMYNGKRGHPSLFPRPVIKEIFDGLNLRDIINKAPKRIRFINVPDKGVILDMDTTEDYKAILEKIGNR